LLERRTRHKQTFALSGEAQCRREPFQQVRGGGKADKVAGGVGGGKGPIPV